MMDPENALRLKIYIGLWCVFLILIGWELTGHITFQ